MMNEPLVSIGMPAYNGEKYIRKALDSLLAQDYQNFELIISDNASTDSTLRICREYAHRDHRIRICEQPTNRGPIANFRAVANMARGNYFMWAAVDDFWQPQFVKLLVRELESHPEAGVAMCAVDRICENGELFDTIRFNGEDSPNRRSYYQMLKSLTSTKKYNLYIYGLFRTELFKQAMPFPEEPGGDRLFVCQFALATRFRYIDQVLTVKLLFEAPSEVRFPDATFNKMQNEDKWVNIKVLGLLARMLFSSKLIPGNRKLYIPVALWRYGWILYGKRLRPYFSPEIWKRLMKFRKRYLLD